MPLHCPSRQTEVQLSSAMERVINEGKRNQHQHQCQQQHFNHASSGYNFNELMLGQQVGERVLRTRWSLRWCGGQRTRQGADQASGGRSFQCVGSIGGG